MVDQVSEIISGAIESARSNQIVNDIDFRNEAGLLVCGICGKPKETVIKFVGRPTTVACLCDCDVQRMKNEADAAKKRENNEKILALKNISLMDKIFEDATFDKYVVTDDNKRNLKICRHYAVDFPDMLKKSQGILMYGEPGTGKSFTAACIANYLLDRGEPVIMTSVLRLTDMIQKSERKEQDIINRLKHADLVIFDDFGVERSTDYALERAYSIIDSRHRSRLPMIVTTNLSAKQMKDENDIRLKRIYDRIFETCYPMQFKGPSWRRKAAYEMIEAMGEKQQ